MHLQGGVPTPEDQLLGLQMRAVGRLPSDVVADFKALPSKRVHDPAFEPESRRKHNFPDTCFTGKPAEQPFSTRAGSKTLHVLTRGLAPPRRAGTAASATESARVCPQTGRSSLNSFQMTIKVSKGGDWEVVPARSMMHEAHLL